MKYYAAYFKTTAHGEEYTKVTEWGIVDIDRVNDPSQVVTGTNINQFFMVIDALMQKDHSIVYFPELVWAGAFIMNYLLNNSFWQLGGVATREGQVFDKADMYKMKNRTYMYTISSTNKWYTLKLCNHRKTLEFRDLDKLLPFDIVKLSHDFKLQHQVDDLSDVKLNCLVLKEAINFMIEQGHNQLTIGSCCMKEFKSYFKKKEWDQLFPSLSENYEADWIRQSYHGGWCYVVPEKKNKIIEGIGTTIDYNSLYPSVLHSQSGNRYPVGKGTYFRGEIPQEALADDKYYFVHICTRFYLKPGYLPTIQIKGSPLYYGREWLTTSDVKYNEKYYKFYMKNGKKMPARVNLFLTMTDYKLIQEHYDLEECEIIDGYYYDAKVGLFDKYIDKYMDIKVNSTGAPKQLAKLMLNNISGKFASGTDSSYKIAFMNDEGAMRTYIMPADDRKPGYIPIGAAITSYGRYETITHAQKNYHGPDKPGFIYADTDSLHCDLAPEQIVDCPEDPKKLGYWKYETCWDKAVFARAKSYMEHVIMENLEDVEPYDNIKCAGMTEEVKDLFLDSIHQIIPGKVLRRYSYSPEKFMQEVVPTFTEEQLEYFERYLAMDQEERVFVRKERNYSDFKVGLTIPGMLKGKSIRGGVIRAKSTYMMKNEIAL